MRNNEGLIAALWGLTIASIVARTGTLTEYTKFCTDSGNRGHSPMFNWSASDMAAMLARIEMCQVGVMERYDESLVVMEDTWGRHFPGLDLSYGSPLNARPDGAMQARTEQDLEGVLGGRLAERLRGIGARSDDMHAKISSELDSRVSQIPDFQGRLDAFRRRCRARSVTVAAPA